MKTKKRTGKRGEPWGTPTGKGWEMGVVPIRDVTGKERGKTGTGKKQERNAFFPFPFLHFWAPVFSRFWPKS